MVGHLVEATGNKVKINVAGRQPIRAGGLITRNTQVMPILWASNVGIWSSFAYSFFYLIEFRTLLQSTDLHCV